MTIEILKTNFSFLKKKKKKKLKINIKNIYNNYFFKLKITSTS